MKLIFESWNKFLKENIDNKQIKSLASEIKDKYKLKDLSMYLREYEPWHPVRSLYLSDIRTHELGTGVGSQALQEIIEFADKNNFVITLIPIPSEEEDAERLRGWYERFGFEDWYRPDEEEDEEREFTKYMIRYPNK